MVKLLRASSAGPRADHRAQAGIATVGTFHRLLEHSKADVSCDQQNSHWPRKLPLPRKAVVKQIRHSVAL